MTDGMARRRATVLSVLTAMIVLGAGVSVWAWSQARAPHGGNVAVADTAATAEVSDQVGAAVKQVFSYDYANLDRTERAASSLLVDAAVSQYQASFAAAKQQAVDQKLVRTTTIGSIGVRELTAEEARLLVFVDQQTLNTVTNQQNSSVAALEVEARKVDGAWKIAGMTAL
ncbi:hypothetical protein [Amycolatopsis taiwanensis]|uniref:Mce-associated membrane protein n=1 Tax=Amycolatopsis taiwanensis TaxID=342230 RepID=A0A9W6R0G8_9PSEU|nr:hypothetical protein [Amycolatopsis taiwanensis]GLY66346.1 hypothetical protein Atai01_29650 [Amycolatopsis taiwanensis]